MPRYILLWRAELYWCLTAILLSHFYWQFEQLVNRSHTSSLIHYRGTGGVLVLYWYCTLHCTGPGSCKTVLLRFSPHNAGGGTGPQFYSNTQHAHQILPPQICNVKEMWWNLNFSLVSHL